MESNGKSSCKIPTFKTKFKKNDIVWALYRREYWPALIRSVNMKINKACVWYLDTPGNAFKISIYHIKPFNDDEIINDVKSRLYQKSCPSKLKEIYDKVMIYFDKKSKGDPETENPAMYFYTRSENAQYNPKFASKDSKENDHVQHKDNSTTIEFGQQLLKCITSGKVNKHLLKIKTGTLKSKKKDHFKVSIESRQRHFALFNVPFLKQVSSITDVFNYVNKLSLSKSKSENMFEKINFSLKVLMQESVIKAISLLKNLPLNEVESMYVKMLNDGYESEATPESTCIVDEQNESVRKKRKINTNTCRLHHDIKWKDFVKSNTKEFEQKIVDLIMNGKTDEHLFKIKTGCLQTKLTVNFNNLIMPENQCITITKIPFINNSDIAHIFNYINTLVSFKATQFTLNVLLPESIIKAISLIKNISLKKAETIYEKQLSNIDAEFKVPLGPQVDANKRRAETKSTGSSLEFHSQEETKRSDDVPIVISTTKEFEKEAKSINENSLINKDEGSEENLESSMQIEQETKVANEVKWKNKNSTKNEFLKEIVHFILSGKTDEHILKIKTGMAASNKDPNFIKSIDLKKCNLSFGTFPFLNNSQREEIFNYIYNLNLDPDIKGPISSRVVDFTLAVSMPETIMKAISLLKNISLEEANTIYEGLLYCVDYDIEMKLFPEETELNDGLSTKDCDEFQKVTFEAKEIIHEHQATFGPNNIIQADVDNKERFESEVASEEKIKLNNESSSKDFDDDQEENYVNFLENELEQVFLQHLRSGRIDDYLLKIKSGILKSRRDLDFKNVKKKSKSISFFRLPIKNKNIISDSFNYIRKLIANVKIDENDEYIMGVLLSESIIKVFSLCKNIPLLKAEEIYNILMEKKAQPGVMPIRTVIVHLELRQEESSN